MKLRLRRVLVYFTPICGMMIPSKYVSFSQEDEKGETIKHICLDDRKICSLLVLHVFQLIGPWITRRMRTYENIQLVKGSFEGHKISINDAHIFRNSPLIVIYSRNQHIFTTYHIHFPYIYIYFPHTVMQYFPYISTIQHQPHIDHILYIYNII